MTPETGSAGDAIPAGPAADDGVLEDLGVVNKNTRVVAGLGISLLIWKCPDLVGRL